MNNLSEQQKAKIFALYIGCKTIGQNGLENGILTGVTVPCHIEDFAMVDYHFKDGDEEMDMPTNRLDDVKMVLKPLLAISDEDALEVAKMHYGYEHVSKYTEQQWKYITYVKDNIYSMLASAIGLFAYQYLIQNYYAVPIFIEPSHPDNSKDAIELGLAISK